MSAPSKQLGYSALAAVPSSTPAIVNTNGTTVSGVQIANASIARASDQLFGYWKRDGNANDDNIKEEIA